MVKELGTIAVTWRRGARAYVNGLAPGAEAGRGRHKRLFTGQDSAEAARRRIGSDACPVPEGHAEERRQGEAPKPSPGKQQP